MKSTTRRTKQLTVTIDKQVMKKLDNFIEDCYNDRSVLRILPRSSLLTFILDWALRQKDLKGGLEKLVDEKYLKTYQAWHKRLVRRTLEPKKN